MASHQPIITVEHIPEGPDQRGTNDHRGSRNGSRPKDKKRHSNVGQQGVGEFQQTSENSLGAKLCLNLHVRRKSSPCIGGIPPGLGQSRSHTSSPSRRAAPAPAGSGGAGGGHRGSAGHGSHQGSNLLRLDLSPEAMSAGGRYEPRRRLSSPPSYEQARAGREVTSAARDSHSSGSGHSSGHGSLNQLSIGGLNASRYAHERHYDIVLN